MSEFKLQARVGFNDDDNWNIQLVVTNVDNREDAKALGQALCEQFKQFLESRGGKLTKMTSPIGSDFKGVILPPDYGKLS